MKYSIIFVAIFFVRSLSITAQQTIQETISLIEQNNPTLSAMRLDTDAEKVGNRTGIYPSNPEAGFNYLWGNPDIIYNRTDFSITQSFDFPTTYSHRGNIAKLRNEQAELAYANQKIEILKEAWQVCAEVIYLNAVVNLLEERRIHAAELAGIWQRRLETGDANILESNRAQINLLTVTRRLELQKLERQSLFFKLASLNGDKPVDLTTTEFPIIDIEPDFNKWYASVEAANPFIQWLNRETIVTRKQEQLNKSLWFPGFKAGYMSEELPGESFRGVTVGLSIPLWQNRNTVKYAKAKNMAATQYEAATRLQFSNQMQAAHSKVLSLIKDVEQYKTTLAPLGNTSLLEKALNSGQISITEYLLELTYYYEAYDQLVELEYSLFKAYGELYPYVKF